MRPGAIDELGYHPNVFACGLAQLRTRTIGFIMLDYAPLDLFVAPYNAAILTGLTAELKAHDHYVLIYPLAIDEDLAGLNALLRSGRVDGVVLRLIQDAPATDALLEVIAAAGMPCVSIERPAAPRFGFPSVAYDDRGGAYTATCYLIEQGHLRIAHLQGDLRYPAAQNRLAGYRHALLEAGLQPDESLSHGTSWSSSDIPAALDRLLGLAEPPTAILAANDIRALSAIAVLRQRGYRVPEDVAVIGFDDIPLAQDTTPPLTTVRIPLTDLGRKAADHILHLVEANETKGIRTEVLPVELVCRGTA